MTLARQINEKLDEIILHNKEVEMVNEDYNNPDFELKDVNTGDIVTREMVLNKAQDKYKEIINDLNALTNNGKNCREVFNNPYYINDFAQDKLIAKQMQDSKLNKEINKQVDSNN